MQRSPPVTRRRMMQIESRGVSSPDGRGHSDELVQKDQAPQQDAMNIIQTQKNQIEHLLRTVDELKAKLKKYEEEEERREIRNITRTTSSYVTKKNHESGLMQTMQTCMPQHHKGDLGSSQNEETVEYCTDEEELERELSHHNDQIKEKRKLQTTSSLSKEENSHQSKAKIPLPPPINVSNIKNFSVFREEVLKVATKPVQFKAMSNNDIKITTQDEEVYRNIKKHLNNLKQSCSDTPENPFYGLEYHTYQLKSDRWYRFVIRGLPSSTNHDDIKKAIEVEGHEVATITNITKKMTINGERVLKTFPLFYVDIVTKENNKNVFEIKEILHCRVTVEPPKKVNGIPQCTNCQQLGHTKNFCNRQARCVKCAGYHHTKECKKQRKSVPTCALCNQKGHTANYKGCEIYQRKIKEYQPKKTTAVQRLQEKPSKPKEQVKPTISGLSYAQVTKNSRREQNQENEQQNINNEPTISDMMKLLSQFQTEMKNNFSQLATRVEKLEKSNPLKKQVKNNNK